MAIHQCCSYYSYLTTLCISKGSTRPLHISASDHVLNITEVAYDILVNHVALAHDLKLAIYFVEELKQVEPGK